MKPQRDKMISSSVHLRKLRTSISQHRRELLQNAIDEAIESGLGIVDLKQAMVIGLEDVRRGLMSNDVSIPDFLLCVDTMMEGLKKVSTFEKGQEVVANAVPLVIGVVEGDPHDLGKNIIAAVYLAHGYRVLDLGSGVPKQRFLETVIANNAKVLALSGMMSTTVAVMPEVIREVKGRSPQTVVMVGGAPLDRALAAIYGADGYAETARTVIEETELAIKRCTPMKG